MGLSTPYSATRFIPLIKVLQVTGREMSGIVEKIGGNVTSVQPGDRVWTSTYYRDVRAGCFQQYVVVPQHTVLPIPSNLSFEEAACLGVAGLTASMTLWKWLSVPFPHTIYYDACLECPSPKSVSLDSGYQSVESLSLPKRTAEMPDAHRDQWMLIWGGSTATGQFATQVAKLSGVKVITVCSSKTASLSKSLGADHVVVRCDRSSEEILDEISLITMGRITRALDLVGPKTASLCLDVCSSERQIKTLGSQKVIFAPLAMMDSAQEVPSNICVETVEMKRFVLDVDAGIYGLRLNQLLEKRMLRLPEIHVLEGGLEDIEPGLEMIKRGDMGGRKVVVKI
jgi:NADPH:quinone reductase-like Zn-dependent oxidoreductase